MGKSNTLCNGILNAVFTATAIANLTQNGTSPLTVIEWALHTANPGAAGAQNTSEAGYTSYTRVSNARTTSGWTTSTAESTGPVAAITWPTASGGSETENYFSVGSASSGAGVIYYSGTVTPSIAVASGVTPQLTTATTIAES